MIIRCLSLFPEVLESYFSASIMGKAVGKKIVEYSLVDIRNFARDRHKTCDDAPYGGGAGMVLKPQPVFEALESVSASGKRVIYPSPGGKLLNQEYCRDLANEKELVFVCGRYEGIDQRIIDQCVTDEISIGDYVLSSGEIAAMVIIDSVFRLVAGVINRDSLEEESFSNGLLEYPHYTRPEEFNGVKVPEILLSGHHAHIEQWRLKERIEKTRKNRPELLCNPLLSEEVKRLISELTEDV